MACWGALGRSFKKHTVKPQLQHSCSLCGCSQHRGRDAQMEPYTNRPTPRRCPSTRVWQRE